MGQDMGLSLMCGFFSNLISFNLIKRNKGMDTCQDMKHRINPTVIIPQSHVTFPSQNSLNPDPRIC